MLVPQAPAAVNRRRAVAELSVAYRQAQAIAPGHVIDAAPGAPAVSALVVDGPPGPVAPPICFTVVYRLREYLDLVGEHLVERGYGDWQRARGKVGTGMLPRSSRLAIGLLLPLFGIPMFLAKKRRLPVCRFAVAADAIERTAGGRVLRVAWSDVHAVHRYRGGYLVDKGDGAMPIPYRCLSRTQRSAFERLLQGRFGDAAPA